MAATPDITKTLHYFNRHFRADPKPCKKTVYNCAVRLSLALDAGGFSVADYPDALRVHNSPANHSHKWDSGSADVSTVAHLVAAEELFEHLRASFPAFQKLQPATGRSARQQIAGRKGIVFFENCFKRSGELSKNGDHIDVWDGAKYGNELLGLDAAGRRGGREDLFGAARRVFFLVI